jgi:hypothetical protein
LAKQSFSGILQEVRQYYQKEYPWLHLFRKTRFGDKDPPAGGDAVPRSGNGKVASKKPEAESRKSEVYSRPAQLARPA